jgi:hypothetical protein
MDDPQRRMKSEIYIREAIVQLLTLKLRAGSSLDELTTFVNSCIDDARQHSQTAGRIQGLDIHRLGSILRAWHTETKYLTEHGLPRPLRKVGKNSLKSLVQAYYPARKFDLVFERLRTTKLIKRDTGACWLPTGRHARISQLSYETLEHLSEGVARYVETVTKNVTAASDKDVLFERSCKVTRLPAREFAAFKTYVGQQAIAFITGIDDWLESRNAPSSKLNSRNLRTAGVYTFAYMDRKP